MTQRAPVQSLAPQEGESERMTVRFTTGELDACDEQQWVARLHEALVQQHPALGADAGLQQRLKKAHAHAQALGFRQRGLITQFLVAEAAVPGFYTQPHIDAWLRRPGRPAEDRLAELLGALSDPPEAAEGAPS